MANKRFVVTENGNHINVKIDYMMAKGVKRCKIIKGKVKKEK